MHIRDPWQVSLVINQSSKYQIRRPEATLHLHRLPQSIQPPPRGQVVKNLSEEERKEPCRWRWPAARARGGWDWRRSRAALRWAAANLLRAGDHLLLLHVIKEPDYEQSEAILWESTGSPLIPLSEFSDPIIAKKYGAKPDIETLDILNTTATQKEIMVVVKVLWGDPREKLCQVIHDTPLSCLVIGSRGLGKLKRVLLGSVSDYVVNNATCPVTVRSASTEG